MFDANAGHVPIGKKIFVEVHATSPILESRGVKVEDILLCEHVTKSGYRNRRNTHSILWTSKSEFYDYYDDYIKDDHSWLKYSGTPDGNNFISEKWRQKALDFLGGEWL